MKKETGKDIVITGVTSGKIVDYSIKDSMNMGAAMAPAAFETISRISRILNYSLIIMT